MWQSWVEIEHYFDVYLHHIIVFEALLLTLRHSYIESLPISIASTYITNRMVMTTYPIRHFILE